MDKKYTSSLFLSPYILVQYVCDTDQSGLAKEPKSLPNKVMWLWLEPVPQSSLV